MMAQLLTTYKSLQWQRNFQGKGYYTHYVINICQVLDVGLIFDHHIICSAFYASIFLYFLQC